VTHAAGRWRGGGGRHGDAVGSARQNDGGARTRPVGALFLYARYRTRRPAHPIRRRRRPTVQLASGPHAKSFSDFKINSEIDSRRRKNN
jgi:hypothetical protein